jgi:hypothetical protein
VSRFSRHVPRIRSNQHAARIDGAVAEDTPGRWMRTGCARSSRETKMKYAATWLTAFVVGIYTTFVAMHMWNWFAAPVLNLPQISFLQMLGLVWLIGLLSERSSADETKLNFLLRIIEMCIPAERKSEAEEVVNSMKENLWGDIAIKIFGQFVGNTLTLALGFALHLFAG